jgi:transcription elongation factor GreB
MWPRLAPVKPVGGVGRYRLSGIRRGNWWQVDGEYRRCCVVFGRCPKCAITQYRNVIMDDDEAPRLALGGKFYMTPQGHRQLRDELDQLMRVERPRIVEIVSWAAGNGDRSENADYQYGKRRLREIDKRARFITKRLESAEVVDPSRQMVRDRVFFGATVTFVDDADVERTLTIVGVDEADMAQGKISLTSPVAVALIKARARRGDEVTVHTPRGVETLEVLSVNYPDPAAASAGSE